MKTGVFGGVLAMLLLIASQGNAQFKSQVENEPKVTDGMIQQESPSLFLGWFNPEKFHMQHSFSMSYAAAGGQGLSLSTYTNSMSYEFTDNLKASADVSMSYSPTNSFSSFAGAKNNLSSFYLSRAQVDYKPWQNVLFQIQYRQMPFGYYYGSPFFDPWYRGMGF